MEEAPNASVVGIGCIRGIVVGLAFEAATGLALYALWQLWRLIR
jgi:hypothetical protein